MARGRQQKWVCKDCKSEFSVQGQTPKFCCSCGSKNIGKAPSYELLINFETKKKELLNTCASLNPAYQKYTALKNEYDRLMSYWKQQYQRGYISRDEYSELKNLFVGARSEFEKSTYRQTNE